MSQRLTDQQKRYCRCVLKVSRQWPKYNPYAVCTASLHRKGSVRCGKYYSEYGFEKFDEDSLRGYATMKKVPGASKMSKDKLIDILYAKVAQEYNGSTKNVWLEYVKSYRADHPELSYKEALKEAASEYRTHRDHFSR